MSEAAPGEALELIAFWRAAGREAWYTVDPAFDDALRDRFGGLLCQASRGELEAWSDTAEGSLALILILDQLFRNLHRGSAQAFAGGIRAVQVANAAVRREFDRKIGTDLRAFFYLPFEHAEDPVAQARSVELNARLSIEKEDGEAVRWASHHRDLIARFGRFPHRNALLGRESTDEELAYLAAGGFAG